MSYIMQASLMKLGAHGKWKAKKAREGRRERGKRSGVKREEEMESQGVRGWRERAGGGRRGWRGQRLEASWQDWICPDREPGPGPDMRALFESLKCLTHFSPSLKIPIINPSPQSLPFPACYSSPVFTGRTPLVCLLPFFSLQISKHTHAYLSHPELL